MMAVVGLVRKLSILKDFGMEGKGFIRGWFFVRQGVLVE